MRITDIQKIKQEINVAEGIQNQILSIESDLKLILQNKGTIVPNTQDFAIIIADEKCREKFIDLLHCVKTALANELTKSQTRIRNIATE